MHRPFQIDLRSLPLEGKDISGTEPASFFALNAEDNAQAVSPLEYDLHIEKDDDEIVIQGRLAATFSLECGRCLERFEHRVEIDPYHAEIPLEKDMTINLTDTIREDTLVALPSYPRCEDGNVRPRQCPAEGRFERAPETAAEEPESAGRGVWDALNQLN
ncbi:MAG: hypothetical protein HS117_14870 [Verrucomicrobiaceae bacterium]|jgi:uncharacterized protein|nr:hypothetical protein [Verrucomicrobiaceae bacterium]